MPLSVPISRKAAVKSAKLGLTEEEMRKYLRKLGANEQEIKAEFEKANNHPPA